MTQNTDQIMVSIIVPTYNHAPYVSQALDNILGQKTEFSYEILVGDDASSDGTQEILLEYAKRWPDKFRLFLRKKNIGASRNVYELLMAAKGKYLATCEGDDYWCDEEKLQLQVAYLEAHPNISGCVHKHRVVDEQGNVRKNQTLDWVRPKPVFTLEDFQGIYLPGQYATFVRRNVFLNTEKDYRIVYKAHRMVADRTAMMLYLLEGDVVLMDRVMSCYRKVTRKDGKNLTTVAFRNNRNRVREEIKILHSMEEYLSGAKQRPVRFARRRKELFCDGIFQYLRGAGHDNLRAALELWHESNRSLSYWLFLPARFVYKCINFVKVRWILAD